MKWTTTRKRASLSQNPTDHSTAAAAFDKQEGRCHLQDCQLGELHDVLVWFCCSNVLFPIMNDVVFMEYGLLILMLKEVVPIPKSKPHGNVNTLFFKKIQAILLSQEKITVILLSRIIRGKNVNALFFKRIPAILPSRVKITAILRSNVNTLFFNFKKIPAILPSRPATGSYQPMLSQRVYEFRWGPAFQKAKLIATEGAGAETRNITPRQRVVVVVDWNPRRLCNNRPLLFFYPIYLARVWSPPTPLPPTPHCHLSQFTPYWFFSSAWCCFGCLSLSVVHGDGALIRRVPGRWYLAWSSFIMKALCCRTTNR